MGAHLVDVTWAVGVSYICSAVFLKSTFTKTYLMQTPFTVDKSGKKAVGPAPALHSLQRSSRDRAIKRQGFGLGN